MSSTPPRTLEGPVLVVGAGLLGTSIGLALRRHGVDVALRDVNPENLRIATTIGAANVDGRRRRAAARRGRRAAGPPRRAGRRRPAHHARDGHRRRLASRARRWPPYAPWCRTSVARYVGSHPMAGSERSGPFAASESLFDGRPWAVTPHDGADPDAVEAVTALAEACGATPVTFTPGGARPGRGAHLPPAAPARGDGRRPAHRRPARAPRAVRPGRPRRHPDRRRRPRAVAADHHRQHRSAHACCCATCATTSTRCSSRWPTATGPRLAEILDRGVAGTSVIPGQARRPDRRGDHVFVAVPDHPGELARLLADAGEIGVNVEDLRIDHDPAREYGLVELTVATEPRRPPAVLARAHGAGRRTGRLPHSSVHPIGRQWQWAWSWRWTDPRAPGSRARRAASPSGSGCATSTPARCTAR